MAALVVIVGMLAVTLPAVAQAPDRPQFVDAAHALFTDLTRVRPKPPNPTTREDGMRFLDGIRLGSGPVFPVPTAYVAAVQRAESLTRQIFQALQQSSATSLPPLLITALDTAWAAPIERCEGVPYRAVPLIPDGGTQPVVYLFGWPPPEQTLLLGRHYRMELSLDGRRIERTTVSTDICFGVSAKQPAFVHPQACAPTEFDVFLNLLSGLPFFMATDVGNWQIHKGVVSFLSDRPRPCLDSHISKQNRWVIFGRPQKKEDPYHFGFVYMDPAAGFLVHYGGDLAIDADGRYRRVPSAFDDLSITLDPEAF